MGVYTCKGRRRGRLSLEGEEEKLVGGARYKRDRNEDDCRGKVGFGSITQKYMLYTNTIIRFNDNVFIMIRICI